MRMSPSRYLSLVTLLAVIASPATAEERSHVLSPAEVAEIDAQIARGGVDSDAAMYARQFGVSLTEAKRRLAIQLRDAVGPREEPGPPPPRPPDSYGQLQQALADKEGATFAGMWWQHQPTYRMIVAFTRDAETTLRKYTSDPIFEARLRPGPTVAELHETQTRLFEQLQALGARPVGGSSDIQTGTVNIDVVGDLARTRAAAASGELDLPSYVNLIEAPPLKFPDPAAPPKAVNNPVKAFPRMKHRSGGIELAVLITGTTVLDNGCLRLVEDRRNLVIAWPNEARLDLSSEPGVVRIFDRRSGKSVRAGEKITLGGSSGAVGDEADVIDTNPVCAGPYVTLGSFRSYAEFEAEMLPRQAQDLAAREKISVREATRRILEGRQREQRFDELNARLLREAPDTYAGLLSYGDGKARMAFTRDPAGEVARLVPSDLQPHVTAELAPRTLAELTAVRDQLLDSMEALGLKGGASIDAQKGRVSLSVEDLQALSRASVEGRLTIPDLVQIQTSGANVTGGYSQAGMEAEDLRIEALPGFADLRVLVAATKLPFHGEADRLPSKAGSLETARYLAAHGFTAEEVRAWRARGFDPVRYWVLQNGQDSIEGRAVIADEVVVGEVVAVDTHGARLKDGQRSSLHLRVIEGLKGAARPGDRLVMRLTSGTEPDGTFVQANGEPMLLPGLPGSAKVGDRYVAFLSEGLYERVARMTGGMPATPPGERRFAPTQELARVVGDSVEPAYSDLPLPPLPQLRRRLAAIDAAGDAIK